MYRVKYINTISKKLVISKKMSFKDALNFFINHKNMLNDNIFIYPDAEYHICENCIFYEKHICEHKTHKKHSAKEIDFCLEWEDKVKNIYKHKDFINWKK